MLGGWFRSAKEFVMKKFLIGLSLAVMVATPAMAEVKKGAMLYDADGRRLGRIDRVHSNGAVWLIYNGEVKTIPGATISEVDGKVTTTLKAVEVRKL